MAIKTYQRNSTERLSEHFRVSEFACHGENCGCTEVKIDKNLVDYLEKIRAHFNAPVYVSSGYRCPTWNSDPKVGGATNSYHTRGQAADIVVSGAAPEEVAQYAESIGILGIGLYDSFVHIDTRTSKYFWYSSAQEYRSTFGGSTASDAPTADASAEKDVSAVDSLPMLKKGDKNATVTAVQILLHGYNFDLDTYGADGNFGAATEKAVKAFQSSEGLSADGIVGAKTWAKLLGM